MLYPIPQIGYSQVITQGPFLGSKIVGDDVAGDQRVDIVYTPPAGVICTKIVFTQAVKYTGKNADGTTVPLKPSDFKSMADAAEKDCDTIISDGKGIRIDTVHGENDPYYNGDDKCLDVGTQGSNDGINPPIPAKMNDAPFRLDSSFPAGFVKLTLDFETAVFCAGGNDKDKFLGVMEWKYEQEKGKNKNYSFTSNSEGQPSQSFKDALTKWKDNRKPTVIELLYFEATSFGNSVFLEWETATEVDNAGFNIYRARTKDGHYRKINDIIIPAQGSAVSGASYSFVDTPPAKSTYYYKLEDVDYYGVSTMHGPEKVRVRSEGGEARRRR